MYDVTFFCDFPDGGRTKHQAHMDLADIGKWIDCYKFTHPNCRAISAKIWFHDEAESE